MRGLAFCILSSVFLTPLQAKADPIGDHPLSPPFTGDNAKVAVVQMIRHEGIEFRPYKDINGNWIVGVGHNITANGMPKWIPRKVIRDVDNTHIRVVAYPLSRETTLRLLNEDMMKADTDLLRAFPWTESLDPVRFSAMRHLAFTLGIGRLMTFKGTLEKMEKGDWVGASRRLKGTLWAKQVGRGRTRDVTSMLVTGNWPAADLALSLKET